MPAPHSQVTVRGTAVGLAIGSVVLFSNFQFGLQTGWVSMMGLPSTLLAFAVFKTFSRHLTYAFTDAENVYVQSLAVAVGTGPLAFGFVGVIPAIEKFLSAEEGSTAYLQHIPIGQLIVWSLGLAYFGVFFAVLLRKQIIVREKLRFPSGSAAAILISVLHQKKLENEDDLDIGDAQAPTSDAEQGETQPEQIPSDSVYYQNIRVLLQSFSASSAYTILVYFVPMIRDLPLFGTYLAKNYLWTFQPSLAYVGQGIIMGLPTVLSMLLGCILGWAILGPMAQAKGWATGPIDDWKTGAQGWILWVSLAVMVTDAVVSFAAISVKAVLSWRARKQALREYEAVPGTTKGLEVAEVSHLLAIGGLVASLFLCVLTTKWVFGALVPVYAIFAAVLLAMFLSVLGVRALGETDLNPVSGIGKISQVLFALIIPRDSPAAVLINLVAGGITEAGAQQAGDLMQDLKTGHLVGASPVAQFYAQAIGSAWSVVLSSLVYRLYDSVYAIPGQLFRIPTAVIWIDCSRLVTGQGLPEHVGPYALAFSLLFGGFAVAKVLLADSHPRAAKWIPSGVAVGIGIYNIPSFTLARAIGGVISAYWAHKYPGDHDKQVLLIILSSGLVLGEGVLSIVTLFMTSLGVPHF